MPASTSLYPKRGKLTSVFSNNKKAFAVTGLVFPVVAFVATLLVGLFFPPLLPVFLASFALGWVAFALIVAGATFLAWGLSALIAASIQHKEESDDESDFSMQLVSRTGSNLSKILSENKMSEEPITEAHSRPVTLVSCETKDMSVQTDLTSSINLFSMSMKAHVRAVEQSTGLSWNHNAKWGLGNTPQKRTDSGILSSISPSAASSPMQSDRVTLGK